MLYQEIAPHPDLRSYVLDYWLFKVPPFEIINQMEVKHTAPADGCVSLLFLYNKPQQFRMALVTGPTIEALQTMIHPDSVYLGIRFIPGMFHALFGDSGLDLKEQHIPAEHLLPNLNLQPLLKQLTLDFKDFKVVDEFLLQLLAQHSPIRYDEEVNRAVRLIMATGGKIPISYVLEKACLSERQLQKRFKRSTYLTMKELAKICRLRHAITKVHLEQKPISDAVFEAGYFDQAHYNHDLHQSTGLKPEAFYQHIAKIEHVGVKPVQQHEE